MNFSDEEYVRLYTSDTVTWKCLEWQGQALLALALRKFDRSGLLEFGRHGAEKALMVATGMPAEIVSSGLRRLLDEEVWFLRGECIFWPKYIEAQTCTRSERVRQRTSRARRASERDEASRNVTDGHKSEPNVTNVTECHPRRGEGMARLSISSGESPERGPDRSDPNPSGAVRLERSFEQPSAGAKLLFEVWQQESGKVGAQYDYKRRMLFERLEADGVTVEIVRQVVRGAKLDRWAREEQKLAPGSILGSAEQREKYSELSRNPPVPPARTGTPPGMAEHQGPSAEAMERNVARAKAHREREQQQRQQQGARTS